jgi:hypothetical protein
MGGKSVTGVAAKQLLSPFSILTMIGHNPLQRMTEGAGNFSPLNWMPNITKSMGRADGAAEAAAHFASLPWHERMIAGFSPDTMLQRLPQQVQGRVREIQEQTEARRRAAAKGVTT